MSAPRSEQADPFRLEIEVRAPGRLPALRSLLGRLRRIKQIQFGPDAELDDPEGWLESKDPQWATLLDDAARQHFDSAFEYEGEQGKIHAALWRLTEPSRRSDPMFTVPGPWSFEAVIEAIYRGEYLLLDLARQSPDTAVLRYDPLAGPFGGTESLVQLVEAFGQRVTHDSWHEGPHPRPEVGWDYERAKRLVAAGQGLQ